MRPGLLGTGELALDGTIRAVSGVLPASLAAAAHGLGVGIDPVVASEVRGGTVAFWLNSEPRNG